ncbi:MAG: SDR family NAD(P)-dependent oxidoreductase [Phycisphaerae bacterium]
MDKRASVVLVTGGGRGIGRAVCRKFARSGWQTVAISRTQGELQETASIVAGEGGRCAIDVADVADPSAMGATVKHAVDEYGRIDALINCAGVAAVAGVEAMTPEDLDGMLSVNVRGVFLACRAVWPLFKEQHDGVIVNISSVASVDPFPGLVAYGGTKAWVNIWSKGLADEGRPHGICVFAVAPGAVETKMLRDAFPDFPADRTLDSADVADMVYQLALPQCRHASGQTIMVQK